MSMFAAVDSAGAVYCIALKKGSPIPTSVNTIKARGTSQQYVTSTKRVTVVIPGLPALAPYNAYCYVQLSDGSGSSLVDVISRVQTFVTGCCQEISFINSPASVFGNASLYSTSTLASSYVFSYALDSAPVGGYITVTPSVTHADGSPANQIVLSLPSSMSFLPTSGLQGNFILNAGSSVNGSFVLSLTISGPERKNFTSTTASVQIVSHDQPLSSPVLVSCVFDRGGGYFNVNFGSSTDAANITDATWRCSRLFIFSGAENTVCSWTTLSVVKGTFTAITKSSLKPGDTLSVVGGVLRAACRSGTNCKKNAALQANTALPVTVQPPANPVKLDIVLNIPTQTGGCSNLTIDLSASTGSGGRPYQDASWTVLATDGDTGDLASYLNNHYDYLSNTVTIPRDMLESTTYSFGVTITNFLGAVSSSSSSVTVSSNLNLPVVSILGAQFRSIKASSVLILAGSAVLSSCATTNNLTYSWALFNSSGCRLMTKSTSADPRQYRLPAYSFKVDSLHSIALTVIASNAKGHILSSGYAAASVYVIHGAVKAAVRGGYYRQNSVGTALTLDASSSSDEDSNTGSKNLLFQWSCSVTSLTSFGSPCAFAGMTQRYNDSVFSLPANQMVFNTRYNFLVVVTSVDGRTASQTVAVTAIADGAPFLEISATLTKFNQDNILVIPATVRAAEGTVAYWQAFYEGTAVALRAAYTPIARNFTSTQAVSSVSFPLAVSSHAFVAGRSYTFRLSAHSLISPSNAAFIEIVLHVNAVPVGGSTTVTPVAGIALSTRFAMVTTGWTDDVTSYPLSYSFAYQLAVSNYVPALFLTLSSPLPYAASLLPAGLLGGMQTIFRDSFCSEIS